VSWLSSHLDQTRRDGFPGLGGDDRGSLPRNCIAIGKHFTLIREKP
jgi:hypothetical protein